MNTCAICDAEAAEILTLYDDRYGYPGTFVLTACRKCGHKSLQEKFTPETLIRLYSDYYPRSEFTLDNFKSRRSAGGFNSWFNGEKRSAYCWVPKNVKVLDIGCGFGETLAYHLERGCEVYGVEADENIRQVVDRYGYNVYIGLFDPSQYEQDFFDFVTLDQVIEHVTGPIETLQGIASILKPGGIAILSTPNPNGWGARLFGRRWINWHAPYHLQHFSHESMRIAAEKAGLSIELFRTLTSSEWLHYQWIHALSFPRMGKPSPFWSPKAIPGPWAKLVLRILVQVHRTKFNHILTRLFDAFGIGDNNLFFLRKL